MCIVGGATDNHPANEFDVRVTEQGVSACYKKEYRFGVLGWTKLLSDKDWDKAQGEVLDMMYAGRGRSTVTLDWPRPEHGIGKSCDGKICDALFGFS